MKKLVLFSALAMLTSINAFSQNLGKLYPVEQSKKHSTEQNRTWSVEQNFGAPKPFLLGVQSRPSTCDTFINLCVDDTLVLLKASCQGSPGGYVCGHNCHGDKSKADVFHLPGQPGNTTITGCLIFFGVSTAVNTTDQFFVRVWDNDGLFADGGTGAPGTILVSKSLKYNVVKSDVLNGNLTYVQFANPLAFPADSSFYVGIEFTYKAGDTVAIINTLDRTGSGLSCSDKNTSVDKFSDNTWHRFTDADDWGLATSQMILPVLCSTSCSITVTPASANICSGKNVALTASGVSTFTWAPAAGLNVTSGATVIAKPTTTTSYTVTGTDGSATCSQTVTVTVKPAPAANFTQGTCNNGAILLTRTGTPTTGVKFKWYNGSTTIAGATNATYTATTTGTYKVKVTITATGCNKTSKAKQVTINCKVDAEDKAAFFNAEAYPNPIVNAITLNITSPSTELACLKLMDFSGRVAREYKNVDVASPFQINDDLPHGVYFIMVSQGTNEKILKVVKD